MGHTMAHSKRRPTGIPDLDVVLDGGLLREMLHESGHDIRLAINGRLALDTLRDRVAGLVLTDLMMPVLDGMELATAMRRNESFSRIPIIGE